VGALAANVEESSRTEVGAEELPFGAAGVQRVGLCQVWRHTRAEAVGGGGEAGTGVRTRESNAFWGETNCGMETTEEPIAPALLPPIHRKRCHRDRWGIRWTGWCQHGSHLIARRAGSRQRAAAEPSPLAAPSADGGIPERAGGALKPRSNPGSPASFRTPDSGM